ncbi:hypothetical protein BT96DRAFT_978616 [Gymnopus androsaceus JB14]|uniref:Uncharacterized protein n=1 Tax=Gymnopus androsaceus JB14 TaxID=1447944 RepID=A0A6A4H7M7_9AGAR|nr:hypothetical protein BT96DRAFT_978616 [Gymnopus androsaceus JB14]
MYHHTTSQWSRTPKDRHHRRAFSLHPPVAYHHITSIPTTYIEVQIMKHVVWQDFTVYNPKGVTVLDFFIAFRTAIAKTIDANHWSFLWKSCHQMEDKDGYIKWVQRVAQDKMMEEFYYSSNIEPYEHGDGWPIICERLPWWKGLPYWHMPLLDHQPPAYQEMSLADFLTSAQNVQNIESMEPKFKDQEMMKEYHDLPNNSTWRILCGKTIGKETIPCSTCDSVQLDDQIKLLHRPWDSVTVIDPDNKSRFGGPTFKEWINSLEGIFVNHPPCGFSMVIAGGCHAIDIHILSHFHRVNNNTRVTILDILQGIRDILQSNQSYRDNDIGEWWIANTWAVEVLSSRHNIPNKCHSLGEVFKIMAVKFIGFVQIPGIKVKLPVDITIAKNNLAIINNN